MRAAGPIALCLLLGAMATASPGSVAWVLDVPEDSFLAVKVDLAAFAPAKVDVTLKNCHGFDGSPASHGLWLFENGELDTLTFSPGFGTLVVDNTTLEVGAEGNTLSAPLFEPDPAPFVIVTFPCHGAFATWPRTGKDTPISLTYVVWSSRLPGTAYVNLTTLEGVENIEVWSGPATVLKPQQFEHGVSASVAPPLGFNGAAAGALLSQRVSPQNDFVGYWWPWRGEVQGHWWCELDKTGGCPAPWNEHYMTLTSKGPHTWSVGYDHYAQVDASQHYALLGIDLGRDDVLV